MATVPQAADRSSVPSHLDTKVLRSLEPLTKALGDPTRRAIYLWVRARGGATAAEVAEHVGVHANVARHHLERLVDAGFLTAAPDRNHTHVGRPSKRYRAVATSTILDDVAAQLELLVSLVGRLLEELPAERAAAIAYDVGLAHGRTAATMLRPDAEPDTDVVAEALRRSGFPSLQAGTDVLRQDGCPFGTLASVHPVLCATERGVLDGLLRELSADALTARSVRRESGGCEVRISRRAVHLGPRRHAGIVPGSSAGEGEHLHVAPEV